MSLKANVGDLIQYRFRTGGQFISYDTRRVDLVEDNGCWVEGGYFVAQKDILTVIPMHVEQKSLTSDVSRELSGPCRSGLGEPPPCESAVASEHRSLTISNFPLEAGQ